MEKQQISQPLNKYVSYKEDNNKIEYFIRPLSMPLRIIFVVLIVFLSYIMGKVAELILIKIGYQRFALLGLIAGFILTYIYAIGSKKLGFNVYKLVINKTSQQLELSNLALPLGEITGVFVTNTDLPFIELASARQERIFLLKAASPLQRNSFKIIAETLWSEIQKNKTQNPGVGS